MSPPKLMRPRIAPVPEAVIKDAVQAALMKLDICELQSPNDSLPSKAAPCIRQKLADAIAAAGNVTVEKRKRCGSYGRDGLWIGLPKEVYEKLLDDATACLPPPKHGGPPPNMGFTVLP